MSIFLVLDALLLLLIALFMPIGYWRGPVKELCVTLGLLLGMQLVDYWARPWGGDLADLTDLTNDGGAFVVAMCFLIASTFIIGYGVGAALGPSWPSFQSRLLGAGIAAFNGMLLLAFALQQVRVFLLSDENEESLEDAFVARFLLDQMGWVVLAVAVIAVPAILYILLSGRRAYELIDQPEAWESGEVAPGYPPRTPRMPVLNDNDDAVPYKADPPARQQRADAAETSRPVTVTEPQITAEPVQPRRARTPRADESTVVVPKVPTTLPPPADTAAPAAAEPTPPAEAAADDDWDTALPSTTDPHMPLVVPPAPASSTGELPEVDAAQPVAARDADTPDTDFDAEVTIPEPPPVPPTAPTSTGEQERATAAEKSNTGRRLRRPRGASARPEANASADDRPRVSEPPPAEQLPEGWQRCRTCHAVLPPGVGICPNCGTVRE